jgi:hypothetical protein
MFWLEGWAGDHAGSVIGRVPNTLLVSVSYTGDFMQEVPVGLFKHISFEGAEIYPYCDVECLTPNARAAFATKIDFSGNVVQIELLEADWPTDGDPWAPGVHLFAVQLHNHGQGAPRETEASTFATAVISDTGLRLTPKQAEALGPALLDSLRNRQRLAKQR